MFKNWFKSANEKRMEEQIAKLREDVTVLQAQLNEWINKKLEPRIEKENTVLDNILVDNILNNVLQPTLDNVLEPTLVKEELLAVVVDPSSILEPPKTHSLESLIMKEPEKVVIVEDKVLEPVATVEKETSLIPPKKRRQSKKAAQLEEALPKMTV